MDSAFSKWLCLGFLFFLCVLQPWQGFLEREGVGGGMESLCPDALAVQSVIVVANAYGAFLS